LGGQWCTPLIPALRWQRQADLGVPEQPGLYRETLSQKKKKEKKRKTGSYIYFFSNSLI